MNLCIELFFPVVHKIRVKKQCRTADKPGTVRVPLNSALDQTLASRN